MVTEACGLAASATDDEIVAVIEAAKARKAAAAVQLHAADKQAVDVAVAYAQGGVVAELRRAGELSAMKSVGDEAVEAAEAEKEERV